MRHLADVSPKRMVAISHKKYIIKLRHAERFHTSAPSQKMLNFSAQL